MNTADTFTKTRLMNNRYQKKLSTSPLQQYLHQEGWIDTAIDHELIFSHRINWYEPDTFTEKFHMHDYYELIFYIKGDIEYLNENTRISPSPYMVTWFKPGQLHTGRLLSSSEYERFVLYFSTDFFKINDKVTPLTDFMQHANGTHMTLSERKYGELLQLLEKADAMTQTDKNYGELVLKSLLIEIFHILNSEEPNIQKGEILTDLMGEVKRYIDENYATINTISDIAEHFFYSREHLSRKFMQAFNISIAHYLSKRRITESLALLEIRNVADVAYAVGFQSQSAFIHAFKQNMQCLPSEYKLKRMNSIG